jgi:precorrin-8X/cobalt-precorrin-8 methylmutase
MGKPRADAIEWGCFSVVTSDYAIVLAGHGSRDPDGLREFEQLIALMRERIGPHRLQHGYLEFARPTLVEAVQASIAAGARRVVMVPVLLFAATHAKNDMPSELQALRQAFPDVALSFGAAMDLHPRLLRLAQQRIVEAEARASRYMKRADTCLVVVGRGTSDPDANSEISKLCRMLEEGMGFGASLVCYSGTAKPLVADGLRMAARFGYRRVIVMPFLLFDGILVKRIYAAAETLAVRHPEIEVLKTHYMGVHPDLVEVFLERADEGVHGRAHMNCSLCKYRVQIVGFERQVGEPQQPHHLPVRGDLLGDHPDPLRIVAPAPPWLATPRVTPPPVRRSPPAPTPSASALPRYAPSRNEVEGLRLVAAERDWSDFSGAAQAVAQRLVYTSGDVTSVDDLFVSPGAAEVGIRAILRCRRVVTDVPVLEAMLQPSLVQALSVMTWCGAQEREALLLAAASDLTDAAAGIRLACERFGNDVVVAIGEDPMAVSEAVALIREKTWRPQLVIGLPAGFIGTIECKEQVRTCMQVPRITNRGPRGGVLWASAVVNALFIAALNESTTAP